ncbi:MAG: THUMP domain-containing protein [Candidatus Nezhaarchaeales archaeon]
MPNDVDHLERLFITLSGEHEHLPRSEVVAILEAENIPFSGERKIGAVLSLSAPLAAAKVLAQRASLSSECCKELFNCNAQLNEILKQARQIDWSQLIPKGSFAVRVERKGLRVSSLKTVEIEQALGKLILDQLKGRVKVRLKGAQTVVRGLLQDHHFWLGILLSKVDKLQFAIRRPRAKPFFHPSALPPKMARLFVNLARAQRGEVFFDPFTGTGSLLIEAGLIGCLPIGCDVDIKMVKGALLNLRYYGLHGLILLADARKIPTVRAAAIAYDPPYGRVSSLKGATLSDILSSSLGESLQILKPAGYLCLASPTWMNILDLASEKGFKPIEHHTVRIHRSLTRRIVVLKKG